MRCCGTTKRISQPASERQKSTKRHESMPIGYTSIESQSNSGTCLSALNLERRAHNETNTLYFYCVLYTKPNWQFWVFVLVHWRRCSSQFHNAVLSELPIRTSFCLTYKKIISIFITTNVIWRSPLLKLALDLIAKW